MLRARMRSRAEAVKRADLESIEVEIFLLGLLRRYGYDFRGYDPEYVRKQIARRLREEELESVSRLSELMLRRPELLERFLAQFREDGGATLFHPAGFWRSFRKKVVPFLRTYPTVRLWMAAGRPEELYSLSILLEEELPRNVQIYATDIHDTLLARAREGRISDRKRRNSADYERSGGRRSLDRFFEKTNGSAVFSASLRKKIVFSSHNPVTDGTFQQCHVILARTVLGPFAEELRARTYRLFHGSLIPLGFLVIGTADRIKDSPAKECYKEIDRSARIYQKVKE